MKKHDTGYNESEGYTFRFNDELTKKHFKRIKGKYPKGFKPQDICNEAINKAIRDWLGEKGILREEILEVKSKINKIEEDLNINNNNLLDLEDRKESLESKLIQLEEKLEKTEERIEEGDVVMNLINAVEKVSNQYTIRSSPSPELLDRLSQETRIKPEIIRTLGKSYHRGKITRKDLEKMEEARVRHLMVNSPEYAPSFEFELTGDNIINYLTGRLSPSK